MSVELQTTETWPLEILDRVLQHGIVVEAARVEPRIGLGLISVDSRVRVTRLEALLDHPSFSPDAEAA